MSATVSSYARDLLAEYRDSGRTILFSTHMMDQAERLCDEICLISSGRVLIEGPLNSIKREMGGDLEDIFVKAVRDAG